MTTHMRGKPEARLQARPLTSRDFLSSAPTRRPLTGQTSDTRDFSPHALVELKREHAHVHLGFADNQVQGWLRSAGLNPLEPIHFPGRRLMTGIWRGEREVAERPNRPTALAHGASR